jgi:hypothetical protein
VASIAGFVIGSALASDLDEPERMRMGLVGALMPSPLVGALIVESLVGGEGDDPREQLRRISTALDGLDEVTEAHGRRLLIDALKTELELLEAQG